MALIRVLHYGFISVGMRSLKARPRNTLWKPIMQNFAITWLGWQGHPVVSLAVLMRSTVPSVCSFTATIIANLKVASSQTIPFT